MSRIGKLPIKIPTDVDVNFNGADITVKGKFGTLENTIPNGIKIDKIDEIQRKIEIFQLEIVVW